MSQTINSKVNVRPKAKYEMNDWQFTITLNALHRSATQLRKIENDDNERPSAKIMAEAERKEVEDMTQHLRAQGEPK